ncbi:Leucine carboxyl methyltransferase [Seminavis robusta]|uniref:Leucine carboxyl methyltransferase n=1 Tax=Seminavis robusta TaxID=568900 RepID=A0A9N8DM00_9STRA|nr:Leucine carboxyl methyltransferase [Seminavis robusta]|eukprot:Sro155_g070400.1 Leucine carboxyl methyltransferase (317) ;mRNA; r:30926-31876
MKDDMPSITAVMVAYCVLLLGGDDYGRSRIPPNIIAAQVAVLVAANLPFGTCPWVLCNPVVAKLARCIAAIWYPGFFEGIGFRKLIIECQVRDFLQQHETAERKQVVVVAAGYDTLALRLCREYSSSVNFWEVDHPATSRVKRRVWDNNNNNNSTDCDAKKNDNEQQQQPLLLGSQPSNMEHVMADLTKIRLDTVLKEQPGYDPSLPTIVIVEGLSMYLTEGQIRGLLFDQVQASVSKGSVVMFDFFGWNERRQTVEVGWVVPAMHKYGFTGGAEPWVWGLDPNKMDQFLDDTDWKLMGDVQSCGFENVATLELTC